MNTTEATKTVKRESNSEVVSRETSRTAPERGCVARVGASHERQLGAGPDCGPASRGK
jgi:hypothetical protein